MNRIKMSFIDNDYAVRASADVDAAGNEAGLSRLLQELQEDLATGDTAYLEIEGADGKSMRLSIAQAF